MNFTLQSVRGTLTTYQSPVTKGKEGYVSYIADKVWHTWFQILALTTTQLGDLVTNYVNISCFYFFMYKNGDTYFTSQGHCED